MILCSTTGEACPKALGPIEEARDLGPKSKSLFFGFVELANNFFCPTFEVVDDSLPLAEHVAPRLDSTDCTLSQKQ